MALNLIKIAFMFNAISVGFVGLLVNLFEPILPHFVGRIFRHGKFSSKKKSEYFPQIEVPKSWFKHFYLIAAPLSVITFFLVYRLYFFHGQLPKRILDILDHSLNADRKPLVSAANTILAVTLFTIHCCKRYYESHHVSVFSDSKMNISIYFVGIIHYIGTSISIIGESEGIVRNTNFSLNWSTLNYCDYLCSIALLLATYSQYKSNVILANLRKNKKGAVVTKEYKIPEGGLFEYISSPLQFAEIVIYICLSIILRRASTFHYVLVWVIVNQLECAYLSHQWYMGTFKNYPTSRKVIIPFAF